MCLTLMSLPPSPLKSVNISLIRISFEKENINKVGKYLVSVAGRQTSNGPNTRPWPRGRDPPTDQAGAKMPARVNGKVTCVNPWDTQLVAATGRARGATPPAPELRRQHGTSSRTDNTSPGRLHCPVSPSTPGGKGVRNIPEHRKVANTSQLILPGSHTFGAPRRSGSETFCHVCTISRVNIDTNIPKTTLAGGFQRCLRNNVHVKDPGGGARPRPHRCLEK